MASEKQCRLLADRIRQVLQLGLCLDPAVTDFIASTCGAASGGQLKALLANADDPQNASLCDLVFSPDQGLQGRLEAAISEAEYRDGDVGTVTALLGRGPLKARIFPADRRFSIRVDVPSWAVHGFVTRLNIGRRLDPELVDAIGRWVEPGRRTVVKVWLRNRRFAMTADRTAFFRGLLEKAHPRDLPACLDFILELLAESKAETDIGRLLAERNRFYWAALQASEKTASLRAGSNMETLLLSGVRSPHIDAADTRRRMRIIDRISRAVFDTPMALDRAAAATATGSAPHRSPAVKGP